MAAVAALSTLACSGGGEPEPAAESADASAPAGPDLCTLLTGAEIEAALGATPGEPSAGSEALGQCTWPGPGGDPLVVLTLERAVLGSFDEFVTAFGDEFGGENPPADEYHPVEGVPGDWAMYVAEEHMVRAFKGDEVLEVSAPGADEEHVVAIAAHAMGRLP